MFLAVEILYTVIISVTLWIFVHFRKFNKINQSIPEPSFLLVFWYLFFQKMSYDNIVLTICQKYGKIVKFKLGELNLIVLNDPNLIREAFNIPDLNGRSNNNCFCVPCEGKTGLVASDGRVWAEQRRFAVRHLKTFGFGKKSMESMIMDEVHEIIDGFSKVTGKPVSIQKKFSLAALNSLWTIITGQRYSIDDPKLNNLLESIYEMFGGALMNPIFVCFPSVAELFPKITGLRRFKQFSKSYRQFFKAQVTEHKLTYDEDNPRDLIDKYLEEINTCKDPESSLYKEIGEKNLVTVMSDMFIAGSETASSTLQWTILYLSQFQNMQKKLRAEIDEIIGRSRMPTLADKPNMPFTEAVIMETQRKHSVLPQGLMHSAINDVDFHGYRIPKGYSILANFQGVHNDPAIWGDPDNFRPERFINENGQCTGKHDSLMPFSVGKRICIGESLARDTLFLFLTSIFQKFEVLPDPTVEVSFTPKLAFVLSPQPFKVIFNEV